MSFGDKVGRTHPLTCLVSLRCAAQLAILRMDGDTYESTHDAITLLYPKVQYARVCMRIEFCVCVCERVARLLWRESVAYDNDIYLFVLVCWTFLSYHQLSSGGFVIVDDYGFTEGCRRAVDEYRAKHGITEAIVKVDNMRVYWRKD